MNSANQKSKAFAGDRPWSDVGSCATPRKPPRSPASPYIYHEGTVSSEAFDSLATRTNRKRSFRRSKKNSETPKFAEGLKPEGDCPTRSPSTNHSSTSTTSSKQATWIPKQTNDQVKQPGNTEPSDPPILNTPSVNSTASIGGEPFSTLSASSQAFVPTKTMLANLNSPSSTTGSSGQSVNVPSSNILNGVSKKQKIRARHPEGAELKKMVSVLLKVVDKATKAGGKSSRKKRMVALYPFVLPTATFRSPARGTRKTSGTDAPRRFRRDSVSRCTRPAY